MTLLWQSQQHGLKGTQSHELLKLRICGLQKLWVAAKMMILRTRSSATTPSQSRSPTSTGRRTQLWRLNSSEMSPLLWVGNIYITNHQYSANCFGQVKTFDLVVQIEMHPFALFI